MFLCSPGAQQRLKEDSGGAGRSPKAAGHRRGIMWLAGATLIAHILAAVAGFTPSTLPCVQPAPPTGTIVALPGSNVTLPCLEGELGNHTPVFWKFEKRPVSSSSSPPAEWDTSRTSLFLPSVHRNHSGSYSCSQDSRVLGAHRLIVEEPPKAPDFTCFRRSLVKDILCEWRTFFPVSPHTKARLWVQRFIGGNHTEQQCRYYSRSGKFLCRVQGLNNEEDGLLLVSVCVANLAGTARSHRSFHADVLLKPDPPANVQVRPLEKEPHKLHVTWRNPNSWGSKYYHLQFQLRYWVENSKTFSEVHVNHGVTSYTIVDALQNLPHIIQVRGREEFDHGNWSEWSRENVGIPWSDCQDCKPETTHHPSEVPFDPDLFSTFRPTISETSSHSEKPLVVEEEEAVGVPLHVFLIMAVSITLGLALAVGVLTRYHKKWGILPFGEMKPNPVPPSYALTPMSPEPPMSASPLLSPPTSPLSESSIDSPRTPDQGPYDVSNADYFLLPK
ncbi:interleukin-6 receptor subunit alpha isoform X2 [Crotalus tigris]|uniref:interleukin-6 receptor subunit alpha isoform X2 n=1 Tax=Crotalus tigris TaxID=88082 RepID=UPI00192F5948|nr:interleukin-6 receptor subunit alpha isoform X2 [Crotalus tigris]